jgi:hypothetical protein
MAMVAHAQGAIDLFGECVYCAHHADASADASWLSSILQALARHPGLNANAASGWACSSSFGCEATRW